MTLALPVQNPKAPDRTLLTAGFELTPASIKRIVELGIRSVWIAYPNLGAVEQYVNREAMRVQEQVVAAIADTFQHTQSQVVAKLAQEVYTKAVRGMIDHVASHPKAAVFIGELAEADDQTMRHAATVTYLSVLMGLKLEAYLVRERKHVAPAKAKELANLGVGAMLHDFGLTQLEDDVRQRYERERDESDPEYRQHTALGFQAVRGKIDPSAATVLLHHHQHFDATGFIGGDFSIQSGHAIHVYARIVTAADQFDQMRRPGHGLPDQPTVAVLSAMLSPAMRDRFDPNVLRTLIEVVPPYAPGTLLRLSDGREAVAVDHNPHLPCRPTVQVYDDRPKVSEPERAARTIDLAEADPSLYVTECEGQPTAEFNFGPKALPAAA